MALALDDARTEHEQAVATLKERHAADPPTPRRAGSATSTAWSSSGRPTSISSGASTARACRELEENAVRDRAQAVADRGAELRDQHRRELAAFREARDAELEAARAQHEQELSAPASRPRRI